MLTKFMLKILGGSEATGLWPGARPNHGLISIRGSACGMFIGLLSAERHQEGPAPQVRGGGEGGRPALAAGGGLRAFGWASAAPIRVNYRGGP